MRARTGSLINRRGNIGVVGEDARVISTNPDRKVSIRGIDNHEVNSISIIKAGRVIKTRSREVIINLN